MDKRLAQYFGTFEKKTNIELEAVFGNKKKLSLIDFNNVVRKLKSLGFQCMNDAGDYHLNIMNTTTDYSNLRIQIQGLRNIQEYCKTNKIDVNKVKFIQKQSLMTSKGRVRPLDFSKFNFRVNLKEEKELKMQLSLKEEVGRRIDSSKKTFRFLKRFSLTRLNDLLKIDCSIVKSSKMWGGKMRAENSLESANIFKNPEKYEIEIELLKGQDLEKLAKFKTAIKYILAGIQCTNYPISYDEMELVLKNYMEILYPKKPFVFPKSYHFVGPSSISLEYENIVDKDTKINIRNNYTVTEKADGLRKLLFISQTGRIYLIDMNMNVQFTGAITKKHFNTIIDGEHVLHDKKHNYINQYLAFDLYYYKGKDVRNLIFISKEKADTRLLKLAHILGKIRLHYVGEDQILFKRKEFYVGEDIFADCKNILDSARKGQFAYEIDGLVFTPANKPVGGRVNLPPTKRVWNESFKWKPPEFNTIDFLVTTQKLSNGLDSIGNLVDSGTNLIQGNEIKQYKTLILRVGFDEKKHGFLNPSDDVINQTYLSKKKKASRAVYMPVPFYPTNPSDKTAHLCKIELVNGKMFIEDRSETFEDNTIVEFRYDGSREKHWCWVPIRVRNDKTAEYRSGGKNYGNAYHVANSVWKTIHNPITKVMITTGADIPEELGDSDVYYKKSNRTLTRGLRDFHNLYIKRILLLAVAKKGGTLIDPCVGKGGDLPKWIYAELSFILGVDIARDNIENKMDGAYARFLKYYQKYKTMPYCLFVNGNSMENIKSGAACVTEKDTQIVKAVFGEGIKNEKQIGVAKYFGIAKNGFDIVSIQFALHYFFENINSLIGILNNISETCKVGGFFIGTCYDGDKIFNLLEQTPFKSSVTITADNGKIVWDVKKSYDQEEFKDDITSLGYAIDVYQESINKTFREYLVNFNFFTQVLENYGFTKLTKDELSEMAFEESITSFEKLFYKMSKDTENSKDYGKALKMTADEKQISFLNNCFIFKKVRNVNIKETAALIRKSV